VRLLATKRRSLPVAAWRSILPQSQRLWPHSRIRHAHGTTEASSKHYEDRYEVTNSHVWLRWERIRLNVN
jgi:hypothetical protein